MIPKFTIIPGEQYELQNRQNKLNDEPMMFFHQQSHDYTFGLQSMSNWFARSIGNCEDISIFQLYCFWCRVELLWFSSA